jgi:glutaredoxin-like protein
MELLNKDVRDFTRTKFESELGDKVTLHFFTQEAGVLIVPSSVPGTECLYCRETRQLLEEVQALSEKIELVTHDFVAEKELAAEFGVDKIPATVVAGRAGSGIRLYGIPSGYEYTSLVEAIVDASKGTTGLSPETKEALRGLDRDIRIQVYVTPTCPYCTSAVRLAHQMAVESEHVRADMVEATEFPHLAQRYGVYGVPKTVVNETVSFEGAVPEPVFLSYVLKAGSPERT